MRSILVATAIAVVIAGLFSPLYGVGATANTAFAQQQNATQGQPPMQRQSVCENALSSMGGGQPMGNQSSSGASSIGNATSGGGMMESLSKAKMNLQEACTALQGNDMRGALVKLIIVEKMLNNMEGNMTSTAGGNATGGQQQNQTNPLEDLGKLFGG